VAKILVADDNSNIQKMVGLALKDQGIDVVAVGNGEAAVRKISDIRPDLVLADVFMPVRNGYEVCKYVKDDPTLSHIPVILLVGAFDPLDEQEAQRVGADGVLKKPFVPPDPLISMVKSALIRAGVSLGPPAAAPEKVAPPRIPAEQLAPKLAALAAESFPGTQGVSVDEEFPMPAKPISIGAGEGPVAFGSLLETPEAEVDAAFLPKAKMEAPAERNWGAEEEIEEEEEVDEEETPRASWRPSALDGVADEDSNSSPSSGVPDWREAAFHGSSPAKKRPSGEWSPATQPTELVEAAEVRSVAVSTLEHKPEETAVPFSGDAWAAAMSAGVEEKIAQAPPENSVTEVPMEEIDHATVEKLIRESRDHATPVVEDVVEEPVGHSEPAAAEIPRYEPPNEPTDSWFSNQTTPWEIDAHKATALASTWDVSPPPEPIAPAPESIVLETSTAAFASSDVALPSPDAAEETFEAATPQLDETQEVSVHHESESISSSSAVAEPESSPVAKNESEMDELVARVLTKMNPDLLQKLTREILKPVIESIVRDELSGKK
jgi:CheY-like chemotaxis protein